MSLNANELIRIIKQSALDAVFASKPMSVIYGEVVSSEPLKIYIDQKITLTSRQLALTSLVQDFKVKMEVEHTTETAGGDAHSHAYTGEKEFKVLLGLKVGEKVILLRCDGGQRFLVLDRIRTEG